jgi:uncharacterized protein YjbI with pentapeptide repeats
MSPLKDDAEYISVSIVGSDNSGQAASRLLFEDVQLRRVHLSDTRIKRVRMVDTTIDSSDLSGAVWEAAHLRRIAFSACRLLGLQLVESELQDILFRGCNLTGALFTSSFSKNIRFERCVLREASFESASLEEAHFMDCDLTGADLRGANLKGADLRTSNISKVQVGLKELQGVIIDPPQAVQVVTLLGIEVREDPPPTQP